MPLSKPDTSLETPDNPTNNMSQYTSTTMSPYTPATQMNWTAASHGINLVQSAHREAIAPQSDTDLEVQLYMDGVCYLLRSLPKDPPSDASARQIQRAMPQWLAAERQPAPPPRSARTAPYLITRWLVSFGCDVGHDVITGLKPLCVRTFHAVRAAEKQLRVLEFVLGWAWGFGVLVYRQTMEAFLAFCRIGDGRVGQALENTAAWLVEGVAGGFRDGFDGKVKRF